MLDIRKDFKKFEQAWNTFAGIIIKEDNVEAIVPKISIDSKVILCCLSQTNKEGQGYIFYLLLKYLAQK